MTDFTVTNGTVEYEHKNPRADYESVTPKVSLSFTIAEGSDPEVVVHKVMGIALRQVEGALTGEVRGHTVEEAEKPRRGRPPRENPTPASSENVLTDEVSVSEPDAAAIEPETKLTLKGDIQPLAQKVSAHLAKVDGNINKLRAVIKDCGGNSLLTIPKDKWLLFMEKAKELLP